MFQKTYENLSEMELYTADMTRSPELAQLEIYTKNSLRDLLQVRGISIEDERYWTFFCRSGLIGKVEEYDWKIVIHDSMNNIFGLVPVFMDEIRAKNLTGFKYKNTKTPVMQDFADKKTPMIFYVTKKQLATLQDKLRMYGYENPELVKKPLPGTESLVNK